ncbi:dTDP-glucose 4,6-dehydratase [Prochlorococcus sp. MIT 0801]|uniref:dTDP-glucose 4,6-dehydratase n=1 Tax=Prochlorococcus sp. MIT 0801 TaxID=1501269 RepID=UPI0004F743E5|nr:dTDP-glucose 4,6-dehydratase [Prochlorococcus sp. MIT 0801]AIQ98281.1 dTDP-glucose 4,6-dehydratase [Prochlorococcus sp. MIT 0801]
MQSSFLGKQRKILVTGGAGFIGSNLISKLINNRNFKIYNLDKLSYASSKYNIDDFFVHSKSLIEQNYELLEVDLVDANKTTDAIKYSDPDLVFHLAAESHVDRSIKGPNEFINSNIVGTYNLLNSLRNHYETLPEDRQLCFKLIHISTDEVFGELGVTGYFSETSQYCPRSPYSASKAGSDHLVNSWFHTYGLPSIITNCCNNYGPRQFPEKLIPLVISRALNNRDIPMFGQGENIRDWLFVDDHISALLLIAEKAYAGQRFCIGAGEEYSNKEVINMICDILDHKKPNHYPYKNLVKSVEDRLGHDYRYAIDSSKLKRELGWRPKYNFKIGIEKTVDWYLKNMQWIAQD